MTIQIASIEEIRSALREVISTEIAKVIAESSKQVQTRLLNKTQAAQFLSVSLSTVDNLRRDALLKSISVRGRIMFRQSDLNQYIESNSDVA